MKKKITIHDIAKRLNITASSVSRALHNNPRISEATRNLVHEAASEMGYQQNVIASALRSGKSGTVGVIIPLASRSFFSSIIGGIEEELSAEGYRVIICQSQQKLEREIANIDLLMSARVDGIMISLTNETFTYDHLKKVTDSGMPLILFDKVIDFEAANMIVIDDYAASYQCVEHLIQQGCKRLAYVSGDTRVQIYRERLRGFRDALNIFDAQIEEYFIFEADSEVEEGKRVGHKILALPRLPDGIVSASDYVAVGIMKVLAKAGVMCPKDVAITGFSNASFTDLIEPGLTTIDQRNAHMGRMAAKLFIEQVTSQKDHIARKVVLAPKLIVRESSTRL
ncbi:MAG: hypothetical protein RIS47_79 [Bacteroidota bacterium]|jgi:LacI family transcriptional regulator